MDQKVESILVVGFNARPIVTFLCELGYQVYAIDYFGDIDLRQSCATQVFTVLNQKPGKNLKRQLYRKPAEYLTILAEILADEAGIDGIIIGSGLDDRRDLWERLEKLAPILGNSAKRLPELRNRDKLYSLATQQGIPIPSYAKISSVEEALEEFKNHSPAVLKNIKTGGGVQTYYCEQEDDVRTAAEELLQEGKKIFIFPFIEGQDASVSVLGGQTTSQVIGFTDQIIGEQHVYAPGRFSYCGNLVPSSLPKDITKTLEIQFANLATKLRLKGINGFDFIYSQKTNQITLLELNPRILGSLEPQCRAFSKNLMELHLNAVTGHHFELFNVFPKKGCIKLILFSPQDNFVIPPLDVQEAVDRSLAGVILQKGQPFCTVIQEASTPAIAKAKGFEQVQEIFKKAYFNLKKQ
ncbi:MAG: ATP-grasp domain-containing protein [Candidatus Hodarchaeota archaeon]